MVETRKQKNAARMAQLDAIVKRQQTLREAGEKGGMRQQPDRPTRKTAAELGLKPTIQADDQT